ncbi:MAG: NAD(P)/FAD-dependent oxidoreductase [Bdellovibrionota bacterium]
MNKEKVIIIGAGAAGLMAARELEKAGISFLIMEATDRVGGRAYTRQEDPIIELGPEFLHGETPLTEELMEEFKLTWCDFQFDQHIYTDGKLTQVPDFWDRLCGVISDIKLSDKDIPFSEYMSKLDHHNDYDKKIARSFIQGFDAADLGLISTKVVSEMKDQACDPKVRKMRRPVDGYGRLMKNLSAPFTNQIRYSHRINKIQWSHDSVVVRGTVGEGRVPFLLEGKHVIVTTSLAVMKNIEFDPMPEELQNYIDQNMMGHVTKMIAQLSSEFFHTFPDGNFPFIASPDMCFTAWWTTTPIHTGLVTGWSGGEKARRLEKKTLEERREVFIQELATITGQCPMKITSWLIKLHHHDWSADENFLGAYSYPRVHQGERQVPETAFEETLFLAGEAYHPEFSGTVEAALTTGKEAAEKIIKLSHTIKHHPSSARSPGPSV